MSGSRLSLRDPVGLLGASVEEGGRVDSQKSSVETENIVGKCELGWRSSMSVRFRVRDRKTSRTEPSCDSTRAT